MVGSGGLDRGDLVLVSSNSLEHAAHTSNEADFLLKNLSTLAFSLSSLGLFVLLGLLLLQDSLYFLIIEGTCGLGILFSWFDISSAAS